MICRDPHAEIARLLHGADATEGARGEMRPEGLSVPLVNPMVGTEQQNQPRCRPGARLELHRTSAHSGSHGPKTACVSHEEVSTGDHHDAATAVGHEAAGWVVGPRGHIHPVPAKPVESGHAPACQGPHAASLDLDDRRHEVGGEARTGREMNPPPRVEVRRG